MQSQNTQTTTKVTQGGEGEVDYKIGSSKVRSQ